MAPLVTVLTTLAALAGTLAVEAKSLPQGPDRCRRSSPQLNECLREGLAAVIRRFTSGNTELGVPALDPLEVPYLRVRQDHPKLDLDLVMKNIYIRGFSDIQIAKVKSILDDVNKLEVTGKTPVLHISGQYISEGLMVNFPLHSAGTFSLNMTEVTSSWVVYLREMSHNHTTYLQIDGFDIDMMPINISVRAAEQLDGDNKLGEALNIILNENSAEIYSMMKGKLSSTLSGVLTEVANQILRQVPESEYLES